MSRIPRQSAMSPSRPSAARFLRRSFLGLALGSGGVAAVVAAGCNRSAPAQTADRPPAPVTAVTAVARDVPIYLDEIGRCAPVEFVNVLPQVSGKITQIHFTDGAEVKKGDPLFTIDARPFEAQLTHAEGMLQKDQANIEMAKQDFARVESLSKTDALTQTEYDAKKNALAVADAESKANKAMVDKARLDVEYCTIRSPIDGRVGQRLVDVGNVVKLNETNLVTVQRLDPIYADFTTSERNLRLVRQYMAAGALKVLVTVPNDPRGPYEGELTFLDTAVQPAAGTVKLRATLKNAERHLWPMQYVQVRVVLETKKAAVLVPSQSIQISQTGPYVYVVTGDSTAEMRPVTTGQQQGDLVVVDKGVSAGEQVVTLGQMAVTPGGKVKVAPAVAAAGGPASPAPAAAPAAPVTQPAGGTTRPAQPEGTARS